MPSLKQQDRYDRIRHTLLQDDVHVTTAFFAAFAAVGYDLEVMAMDSEALLVEIDANLNTKLSPFCRAKILMGQGAYFTDLMVADLPSFIDFANMTLAQDPPRPDVWNPANVIECAAAVLELSLIVGVATPQDLDLSEEIRTYMGLTLVSEGSMWPFKPLTLAIMPEGADPADEATFGAMSSGTKSLAGAVNRGLWEHGRSIFEQLKHITNEDGEPSIMAADMTKHLLQLLGSLVPAAEPSF